MLVKNKLLLREERGGWEEGIYLFLRLFLWDTIKTLMQILGKDCALPPVLCTTLKTNYEFATEGSLSSQL